MRTKDEIQADIDHLGFALFVLDEHRTALKTERDQHREDEFAKNRITKRLAEVFKTHGLYIVDVNHGKRSKDLYALAKQMWRSWSVLVPFIKRLSANKNKTFVYHTTELSAPKKNDLYNLCHVLASKKWIAFEKEQTCFVITPSLTREQKRFLHGAWAEEVTLYLIDKTLKCLTGTLHLKYRLFWDVRLKLIEPRTDKQTDMQLDLVAQVSDRFYVFETKSGTVLSIDKWVDRTRLFDLTGSRFITCTADPSLNPKIFEPFRLFSLPTLEEQFLKMLQEDFSVAGSVIEGVK